MDTLDQRNEMTRRVRQEAALNRHRSGVACNECGAEMYFPDPGTVLATFPAKKLVRCECGEHGYLEL